MWEEILPEPKIITRLLSRLGWAFFPLNNLFSFWINLNLRQPQDCVMINPWINYLLITLTTMSFKVLNMLPESLISSPFTILLWVPIHSYMSFMTVYIYMYIDSSLILLSQKNENILNSLTSPHIKVILYLWLLLPLSLYFLPLFSRRKKETEQHITFTVWACFTCIKWQRIIILLFLCSFLKNSFLMDPEHGIEILMELSTITWRSFFLHADS